MSSGFSPVIYHSRGWGTSWSFNPCYPLLTLRMGSPYHPMRMKVSYSPLDFYDITLVHYSLGRIKVWALHLTFAACDGYSVWLQYYGHGLKAFCLTRLSPSWYSGWREKSFFFFWWLIAFPCRSLLWYQSEVYEETKWVTTI